MVHQIMRAMASGPDRDTAVREAQRSIEDLLDSPLDEIQQANFQETWKRVEDAFERPIFHRDQSR